MATALVTGGTSGIGLAFANALARRDHDLVLVARDTERLERTAELLRGTYGVQVEVLAADLADRAAVDRVASRLLDPVRTIDLLVNNAGFGVHARLTDEDLSEIELGLDVMCRAVVLLGGAAGRAMRERGHGAIVTVSSVAGYVTMGGYSALKAFVTTWSESLSVELAGSGVTVTALAPGWVRTEFHERAGIRTTNLPGPAWVDVDRLVEECLRDVARGRVVSIPTTRFTIAAWLARHAPRAAVRAVSGRLAGSRRR
ncbi:SDR family NAD(P)-dependent oxidoreductase [Angustibacter aerolatus]